MRQNHDKDTASNRLQWLGLFYCL